jgi:hypothetical protein
VKFTFLYTQEKDVFHASMSAILQLDPYPSWSCDKNETASCYGISDSWHKQSQGLSAFSYRKHQALSFRRRTAPRYCTLTLLLLNNSLVDPTSYNDFPKVTVSGCSLPCPTRICITSRKCGRDSERVVACYCDITIDQIDVNTELKCTKPTS